MIKEITNALRKLGIENVEQYNKLTNEDKKDLLNKRFKEIQTYDELEEFIHDCEQDYINTMGYAYICSKRSGAKAFAFTHRFEQDDYYNNNPYAGIEKFKDRVDYLYDGISSEGSCMVKDIHKYLKIVAINNN